MRGEEARSLLMSGEELTVAERCTICDLIERLGDTALQALDMARPMRFVRAVLIACLSPNSIVIPCTILLGTPVTLFAQQSGQESGLDVRRPGESLEAAERAPLGNAHLGLNLSYLEFRDNISSTTGRQTAGYVGALVYGRLFRGLYLGGEVGKARNLTFFGDDVEFLPLELNAKYAFQAGSHLVLDVGGGLSYSHVEIDKGNGWYLGCFTECPGDVGGTADDWLLGGQMFADVVFRMGWFSLVVNGKYQITEDFKESDLAFDNWRVGVLTIFAL
jgi:hypothetical protein